MDYWKQYCRQVVILDLKESFMEVKKYKRKYNKLFKLDKSNLIIREEDEKLFVHEFIYCLDNEILKSKKFMKKMIEVLENESLPFD